MSASNWDVCPVCRRKAIIARDEAIRTANASYGKVAPEEYERLKAIASKPLELESHFREDYEIGVTEAGEFFVIYHGHCQTCTFGFDYTYDKKLTEIVQDRPCCECGNDYTCDLLDPKDCGVWCPKCRVVMDPPKKKTDPGPKLNN